MKLIPGTVYNVWLRICFPTTGNKDYDASLTANACGYFFTTLFTKSRLNRLPSLLKGHLGQEA
jgi:hypothetical protein